MYKKSTLTHTYIKFVLVLGYSVFKYSTEYKFEKQLSKQSGFSILHCSYSSIHFVIYTHVSEVQCTFDVITFFSHANEQVLVIRMMY